MGALRLQILLDQDGIVLSLKRENVFPGPVRVSHAQIYCELFIFNTSNVHSDSLHRPQIEACTLCRSLSPVSHQYNWDVLCHWAETGYIVAKIVTAGRAPPTTPPGPAAIYLRL